MATTGVYCRPSCSARPARRENVSFHRTAADAEAAGFRACKRCRPDGRSPGELRAEAVARACRLIDEAEEPPSLEALAAAAGMSRFYFHRVFKEIVGVTPKAYAAAGRRARVQSALREAPNVTAAIYEAGYNASSRFYENVEAKLGMSPSAYRKGGRDSVIRFAVGECSLGSILVAASDKGVCAIQLGDDPDALVRDLQDRFPRAQLIGADPDFEQMVAPGDRLRRGAGAGARPAARCARHRVSAAGLAGAARDSGRRDRELCRDRPAHRPANGRAGGGAGLRIERALRWPSHAIAWCGTTARSPAIAGAWSASAPC